MPSTFTSLRCCLLLGLLVFLLTFCSAQTSEIFTLTANSLQSVKTVGLDKLNWRYSPNDDPGFADSVFDDSSWETLKGTAITLSSIPKSGWHGIGWFRLRLQVDPALANQPLALVMVHYGASEIYLDGKLIERFGTVGTTPESEVTYNPNTLPINIVLDGRGEHVLVVRHSCMEMRELSGGWGKWIARQSGRPVVSAYANRTNNYGAGFGVWLMEAGQARDEQVTKRAGGGFYLLNFGLLLAIGLLHLLLFWFYPRLRANLFFGLFACSSAASNIVYYRWSLSHQSATGILLQNGVNNTLSLFALGTLLAFMYSAFAERIPRWFWVWMIAAALYIPVNSTFVSLSETRYWYLYIQALTWFPVLEVARGMSQPIKNKVSGARIVCAGMLAYTLYIALVLLILVRGSSGANFSIAIRSAVILFLTVTISVFLAHRFARTSLELEDQLVQVKQLSAAALEHDHEHVARGARGAEGEPRHGERNRGRGHALEEIASGQAHALPSSAVLEVRRREHHAHQVARACEALAVRDRSRADAARPDGRRRGVRGADRARPADRQFSGDRSLGTGLGAHYPAANTVTGRPLSTAVPDSGSSSVPSLS